ncbi:hypothetical protein ADUPG1_004726, partial [Aduncisulcus paluster]
NYTCCEQRLLMQAICITHFHSYISRQGSNSICQLVRDHWRVARNKDNSHSLTDCSANAKYDSRHYA